MNEQTTPRVDTQTTRRVKYGVNVAVVAVVAITLAVLLNILSYRNNLRYDFTITREYTLSPQTRQVIDRLDEDVEIATVFSIDNELLERVNNLAQEYDHASPRITTRHIDLASKPTAFYERLRDRYAESNQPLRDAVTQAGATITEAQARMKAILEPLSKATEALPDTSVIKDHLFEALIVLTRLDQQMTTSVEDVNKSLEGSLPDYAGAKAALVSIVSTGREGGTLAQIQKLFDQIKQHADTPNAVKNTMIELNEQLPELRTKLREADEKLGAAQSSPEYDRVRQTLATTSSIVVFKGQSVRAIPVTAMFPDQKLLADVGGDHDARFIGEERITGALMSLSMSQPPLVVFVVNREISAIGSSPNAMYNHVARRLQSVGFDVRQWNPQGQMTPDGRMAPPSPMPEPAEGQRAVWVIVPRVPGGPMDFMSANAGEALASLMDEKLEAGHGVMVMFTADPTTSMGAADPLNTRLDPWGITVQLDRVVLQQVKLPDDKSVANNYIQIKSWPQDLPVTAALAGMDGVFTQACPLVVGPAEGVTQHPLVVATGRRLWAERDFADQRKIAESDYDEATAADEFTLAVAAERGDQRLVAVADPIWATDGITTFGRIGEMQGPGVAELGGALFPANAELFVNSVLWLAHMDQMIAASPRTQDIPRIAAMDDATIARYRWLLGAGLPVAVLLVGFTAWFMRRKG